jgi:hypothetical protein
MNVRTDRLSEVEQAAAAAMEQASAATNEFEGEVREFVRRDASFRQRPRPQQAGETAMDNMNSLIQRVSTASVEEIDRVITELQAMRDLLRSEADRVQREISNYAGMSQAAMSSMKIIADSLRQLKPSSTPPARDAL